MFEFRLKVMVVLFGVALAVIVARLVDLQILHADDFRHQAEKMLIRTPEYHPFVRGRILDRFGRVLAADEPGWEIRVQYDMMTLTDADDVDPDILDEVDRMWADLSRFGAIDYSELQNRVDEIRNRILAIRKAVARRFGYDQPIAEERKRHPILTDLDDQGQVSARAIFDDYPWVSIEAATHRRNHGGECLAHIIGRMGPVYAEDIQDDPNREDPRSRYISDDRIGKSGVEKASEAILRGRRGLIRMNRYNEIIEQSDAEHGEDVTLTIRHDLQARLYDLLAEKLQYPEPGGAIVVLDIPTREVLAIVSYPSYNPDRFEQDYPLLRNDTSSLPLWSRSVAMAFEPGSIIKPLTCLAGMFTERIAPGTIIECTGYQDRSNPSKRPRCWLIPGTGIRKAHGAIDVRGALEGSCNIYTSKVAQWVGIYDLTFWFKKFGIGLEAGTHLPEESKGINPSPDWLAKKGRNITPGLVRLYGIGQGDVQTNVVQAANLCATYASGIWKPVTLIREMADTMVSQEPLPGRRDYWQAIREGMYRVVNAPHGTARKYAKFNEGGYVICGKTGSATVAKGRAVSYRVPYVNSNGVETVKILPAGSRSQACADFRRNHPDVVIDPSQVTVYEYWPAEKPAGGGNFAHAWFIGYLQKVNNTGDPQWHVPPRIAFAVFVEFGGSGGRRSGPIARDVAHIVLDTLGPDLDPDNPPGSGDEGEVEDTP